MPETITPVTAVAVRPHASPRRLTLALLLAVIAVFVPAQPGVAEQVAPEVKSETLPTLPEQSRAPLGDEGPAVGARPQGVADVVTRSRTIEAPLPFTSLGLRGTGPVPELHVRTRDPEGQWSDWADVEILDESEGPTQDSQEARIAEASASPADWTTDSVWAGEATHVQVEAVGGEVGDIEVTFIDAMGLSETRVERIGRALRSLGTGTRRAEAASRPKIISRAQWGANESWRKGSPSYARVRFGVVHHTATGTPRSRSESEAQMRSMYHWHTQGNGWSDIGYNFVVDPFGNVFEGRYGGVDKGVVGAHTGGWNTGAVGVTYMGNTNNVAVTSAGRAAMTDVLAWKFQLHGVNPSPTATVTVNGYRIRTIEGHRNFRSGYTRESSSSSFQQDCPGRNLYGQMGTLRKQVAKKASSSTGVRSSASVWRPISGDWNGNGKETPGWFRDGRWKLTDAAGNGAKVDHGFSFGTTGDLPVVGDWNADGTDTIGVFRDGAWHLRNAQAGGKPDISFHYGRAGDTPVPGDWNASGRDTVGVVRGNRWYLRAWEGTGAPQYAFSFGKATDQPLAGNWDGSLVASGDGVGVRRGGQWYLRDTAAGGRPDHAFSYGRAGDLPVVADWNGPRSPKGIDALKSGIGVVRGGKAWHLRPDASGGAATTSFDFAH